MIDEIANPSYELPHDVSNAAILPGKGKRAEKHGSEKRDSRGRLVWKTSKRVLTKKKVRELEKIVERKEKAAKRNELFASLSQYQIDAAERQQLQSVAHMQSKVTKRHTTAEGRMVSSVAGSRKRARKAKLLAIDKPTVNNDASSSSSSDSDSADNEVSSVGFRPTVVTPVVDVQPSITPLESATKKIAEVEVEADHKLEAKLPLKKVQSQPAVYVPVHRTPDVQKARYELPILAEEQPIVEAIRENDVVIICGETGSGKTTQVPQFLYEAGFCQNNRLIGITEPRRVAAISMSHRVGAEMSLPLSKVSYQIRYEGNTTADTQIKFMTDGVLLKEMQKDFLLTRYAAIIIDEAHERSMYSDILIGLLSRIVPLRAKRANPVLPPLKLIIMSATLRVEDFKQGKLFKREPQVISVDSRQFPVTVYFNKVTPENYLLEAYRKVCKIHRLLPEGNILVFVSGQREVFALMAWLKRTFPMNKQQLHQRQEEAEQVQTNRKLRKRNKKTGRPVNRAKSMRQAPDIDLDSYLVGDNQDLDGNDADLNDLDFLGDIDMDDDTIASELYEPQKDSPLVCLPLYSLLPTHKQQRVFDPSPVEGVRVCVVATNVAETSLTIPGIKYVIDTGKVKLRSYDPVTGVSQFNVTWVSKASANQRAGRAGRVAPGHCYRLYSSAVFTDFALHSTPEILNKPIDELVLQMKHMNIVKVANFPFPSAPDALALAAAEQRLIKLGALELSEPTQQGKESVAKITALGRTLAGFPVIPMYGKILALANQYNLMPYAITLVAALSVREPLINLAAPDITMTKEAVKQCLAIRKMWADRGQHLLLGDWTVLLKAVGAAEYQGLTPEFCDVHGLRFKAMQEIRKLRRQLTNAVNAAAEYVVPLVLDAKLVPPNEVQAKLLRQVILAGLSDRVAKKVDQPTGDSANPTQEVPKGAYQTAEMLDYVFINANSVLRKQQPEFLVYQEIVEIQGKKMMQNILAVEPEWLPLFAPTYCQFGEPLAEPCPRYNPSSDTVVCHRSATYGPAAWTLPPTEVPHPLNLNLYRYFALGFLEGSVCPALAQYRPRMLAAPQTLLKSWSVCQRRNEMLLSALVNKNVSSRRSLEHVWEEEDKFFLLKEYLEWIPEALHDNVQLSWPPIS